MKTISLASSNTLPHNAVGPLARCRGIQATWRFRARTRQALGRLSARALRDIGISPAEASAEAGKPFWEA